jgi:putative transposase
VTLSEAFCISALQSAWRGHGQPEICNSDQGAQFTSQAFTAVLKTAGVRISRDGKGRARDNIMVERLWRTVKYAEIYRKEYRRVTEVITALKAYCWFYNHERPHQGLAGATPVQVHRGEVRLAA